MKHLIFLVIIIPFISACEKNLSSSVLINDQDIINDIAFERLSKKYYDEGAHPFARPFIEQLKQTQKLRKKILNDDNSIPDYRKNLLDIEGKLLKLDSLNDNNLFQIIKSDSFFKLDNRDKSVSLLFFEYYLINQILNKYLEYFYSFDIAEPMLTFKHDAIEIGDSLNAELYLTVTKSALIFFTQVQVIDSSTGKIEWKDELKTNWRSPNSIHIDYKPSTIGNKVLQGNLIFSHEGKDINLEYQKGFKVKSR